MDRKRRRLSDAAAATLRVFLAEPEREWFGLDIIRMAGIASGSLYPILHRLEAQKILVSRWESIESAVQEGRRPRRQYRLDPAHVEHAQAMYDEWLARDNSL